MSFPCEILAASDDAKPPRGGAEEFDQARMEGTTGRRLLVVEDEYFIALQIEDWLTSQNFEVVEIATTAEEALSAARNHRPDLILMDIRLAQGGDGVRTAIEAYATLAIRSLFVSAHSDAGTKARAEPALPAGWVTKPFTEAGLLKAVDEALHLVSKDKLS